MCSVGNDGKKSHRVLLHFGLRCMFGAIIVATGAAQAQDSCEEHQKLTASDASVVNWFGRSVSASGDTTMVGAQKNNCAGSPDCGSAYVYRFDGTSWAEKQKLRASDAATSARFGSSVFVDGNTALIGAYRDACLAGPNCGSAYVFRFDGTSWTEEQKLTASDAGPDDWFGQSVALSGPIAVVGASRDRCMAGSYCGSAYVFRFDGSSWVAEQKLTASHVDSFTFFGISVSVSGDTVLVGAHWDDCAAGDSCGSAYVFRFDGTSWVEEQKLTASDAAAHDGFGFAVSLSGNTALVGSLNDACAAGDGCGSVFVFHFNGTSWVEVQKLTASDAGENDGFGFAVSVNDNTAVVGAQNADCTAGNACGSAYVFHFNGMSWVENQKLIATDAAGEDSFGGAVSVSANTVVVGAYHDDCGGRPDCGSAYVYDLDQPCAFCGNGRRDPREECDGGFGCMDCVCGLYLEPTVPLSIDCRPSCGDGELDGGEECDGGFACTNCVCDAGFVRTVPVSLDCQPKCGNGIFDLDEECDGGVGCTDCQCDAGFEPTDPPFFDCRPICGNGILDTGEECDGGLGCLNCACGTGFQPTAPRSLGCQPICGNGILDPGEECDGMNDVTCPGACLSDCICGPFCGDGTCNPSEDSCACSADCGMPPSSELPGSTCTDGLDNDCDGVIDSDDPDCTVPPIPTISAWGMIVVTLLLLAAGKIVFRKTANATSRHRS